MKTIQWGIGQGTLSHRFLDVYRARTTCLAGTLAKEIRTIGIILLTAFFIAIPTSAATFNITTTNDTLDVNPGDGICADVAAACSLRAAISEANALSGSDTILLDRGTFTQSLVAANEDANAGGDWDITSVITMIGEGEFTCVLQAAATPGVATERVINVREGGDLTLRRLTVRNGNLSGMMTPSTRGAGIENRGILTLDNVVVRENQITSVDGDPYGAGIHNAGIVMTMNSTSVVGNTITRPSGGSVFGGGIASTSDTTITITNGFIGNNNAFANGGFAFGAGIYLDNRFTFNISGAAVAHNLGAGSSGSNGSGVSAISNAGAAAFNATGSTFRNNSGGGQGGGGQGSGLYFLTTATAGATLITTLDRVTVKDNIGNSLGGGIGAAVNAGNLNINILNSSITRNVGGVGGIWATDAGPRFGPGQAVINLTNTTVSSNGSVSGGGGIYLQGERITANLNHVTVAGNEGGLGTAGGIINLKNSIVSDNNDGTGRDIVGSIISGDYNHIESFEGATITGITTNNTTGDARLGPLVEHVGGGAVHLPEALSPVLDTIPIGTNDCGTNIIDDQRGIARPQGVGCDKGSVERVVSARITGRVTTFDGQGIRNALVTLTSPGLSQPLTTRTSSFGWYSFPDLPGEQTYSVRARAQRFTFTCGGQGGSRSVYLTRDVLDLNIAADEPFCVAPPEK